MADSVPPRLVYSESEEYFDPSWERVESLIRSMNGETRTDVFLGDADARRYLAVSGGNQGRYVVGVQEPTAWYYLVDSEKPGTYITVVIGGLSDNRPEGEVHDLATALAAAKYYLEIGVSHQHSIGAEAAPRENATSDGYYR